MDLHSLSYLSYGKFDPSFHDRQLAAAKMLRLIYKLKLAWRGLEGRPREFPDFLITVEGLVARYEAE